MPEQALYLKWRPLSFNDVIGQDHVTRTLRNSLKTGRIRHAYLFSGPRGTGKTSNARLLAKAVNCLNEDPDERPCNVCANCVAVNEGRFLDLIEIDAATHTGVDDVRELRDKIAFAPGEGRYKVYIIDEVHRFTGNAFDALLKTLEEPPDHAIFVLATTEIDKVPSTIKSRCLQFEFRRVSMQEVADRLAMITDAEGLEISRGALELIARHGTGSVRDSISLLDQIVSDPNEVITLEVAQRILGTADTGAVRELVETFISEDVTRGLNLINNAVDSGSDPRQFGQQIVEHLRSVMLAQTANVTLIEASEEDRELFARQAEQISRGKLLRAIRAFNDAVNNYKGGWQPQLTLELALIDSVRGPEETVQVVQQTVVQQQKTVDEVERVVQSEPGTPPVITLGEIENRWKDMLQALHSRHTSAPAVVNFFRPQRVDGNVLYLVTDSPLYFERLHGQDQKLQIIERALRDVHHEALRVQVKLVEEVDQIDEQDKDIEDPLLRMAVRELGGHVKQDDD